MTIVNSFFRAAVSSFLIAAALFLLPCSAFADFRPDSSFVAAPFSVGSLLDLAAGSAVDGALHALGVHLGISAGASLTTLDLIRSVAFGTPLGVVGYQYNDTFYNLVDQSTIRIRDDVVTIDGIDYKDVWLPHDAAVKFRVNAFDFISFYNIVSESSGTYASGSGYLWDIPIYEVDGVLTSSSITISGANQSGSFGSDSSIRSTANGSRYNVSFINPSETSWKTYAVNLTGSIPFAYRRISNNFRLAYLYPSSWGYSTNSGSYNSSYIEESFDFNWVSGNIPADSLPSDYGLRFRVPSSYLNGLPSSISPDLTDYVTLVQDLSNALEQARLADVVESTAFEEFDTPAPPVPSTGTIAEEPYSSLDGSLSGIQDSLDNIDTNIGTVDESLDDIQDYASDAADSLQSIDTNLSQSVSDTAGIKGFIQTYLPGIHSFLNGISTSVSNIAGSVAAADETFFGNVVDSILAPFTPVFDIFKSGVGIWRYVVAWVGNISAPFSWTWSTLSQANGILVSPILASAAAAVVLAVYKKFGR